MRLVLAPLASVLAGLALLASAGPGAAQSVNIDFGAAGDAPSPAYAAAGLAGVWNEIAVHPPGERADLVGLDGALLAARIYGVGGTDLITVDDPATSGDDDALVDDMLIGFNSPVDVCIWVENLENGNYVVVLYALTPNNPGLQHRVRVDFANPGPTMIGGGWPGAHQEDVTFERFAVTVTDGKIGLHSGLYGGQIESGLNAIQIIQSGTAVPFSPGDARGASRVERVYPNPASGPQTIELSIAAGAREGRLELFDAAGRLVWRAPLDRLEPGTNSLLWSGLDLSGRRVPPATYFVRLAGGAPDAAAVPRKVVRIR